MFSSNPNVQSISELFTLALSSKFLGTSDVSGIDIDKLKFEFSSRNRSIKGQANEGLAANPFIRDVRTSRTPSLQPTETVFLSNGTAK